MNSLTKENYLRINQIKDILTYIGKLISSAILILLVIVGMFLIPPLLCEFRDNNEYLLL